ncbi:Retinol dehydrogenase 14 [Gaertneriomyces sp. JEL0708]|nr:Retinol dehydrogenase 14 [Gaertneriomyces sp. JEL0708]
MSFIFNYFKPAFSVDQIPDMSGKTVIITGGASGLGRSSAVALARNGARVVITARSDKRGTEAVQSIKDELNQQETDQKNGTVEYGVMDNEDLESVRSFVDWWKRKTDAEGKQLRIDVLMLNAGIMAVPYKTMKNPSDIEAQFGVNHLAHFYLTNLIIPYLSPKSRIVAVSSMAAKMMWSRPDYSQLARTPKASYSPGTAYTTSKLANILFTKELQKRLVTLGKPEVRANALHPGSIATNLVAHTIFGGGVIEKLVGVIGNLVGRTPDFGSLTQLYLATSPDVEEKDYRGQFFLPTAKHAEAFYWGNDEALQKELWELSESIIKKFEESRKSS